MTFNNSYNTSSTTEDYNTIRSNNSQILHDLSAYIGSEEVTYTFKNLCSRTFKANSHKYQYFIPIKSLIRKPTYIVSGFYSFLIFFNKNLSLTEIEHSHDFNTNSLSLRNSIKSYCEGTAINLSAVYDSPQFSTKVNIKRASISGKLNTVIYRVIYNCEIPNAVWNKTVNSTLKTLKKFLVSV